MCVCVFFIPYTNSNLLEEVPIVDVITTVHFPDVDAIYFRSLLEFLYFGQISVPANDVEHLHDLLDLLQIKPGDWRTCSKDDVGNNLPGEKVEVLSARLYTKTPMSEQSSSSSSSMDSGNSSHQPRIDINSNEGIDATAKQQQPRRDSTDSSPGTNNCLGHGGGNGRLSVKRERTVDTVASDEPADMRHLDELDLDDDIEEEQLDNHKKGNYEAMNHHGHHHRMHHHRIGEEDEDEEDERHLDRYHDAEEQMIGRRKDSLGREMIAERRRSSSSDPVNLSLGMRDRDEDSNDGHIDVETIGNAPSKVSRNIYIINDLILQLNSLIYPQTTIACTEPYSRPLARPLPRQAQNVLQQSLLQSADRRAGSTETART